MNEQTLQRKATSAFVWDMAGIFAKQGIAFLVSVFLARLLLPAEFGLVAMAMVFISITQIFADFGLASALIQNKENTSLTYSSVFYLNITVGFLLFALFYWLAPWIGQFYNDPQIGTLVRYLSLNFILSSVNQVQQTILRKNIDFKKITIRTIIAQVSSGIVSIVLAYRGWGVNALVVQNLLGTVIGTFLLWRVAEWKPRWEFSWTEIRKLTGFSVYVFLSNVTAKLASQLDTLVVGKVFSPTTLGLYSRASSLNSLVTTFSSTSISKISFSLLSHIQDDRERFVSAYFRMLALVAFSAFGLSGALVFAGADIITILFGENWTPSIFIFRILVLKSFTYPVSLLIVSVFWAGGKSRESFWYGNVSKVLSLLPLIVALGWGFNPFLYAVVVMALVSWILTNWFVSISFSISFMRQCKVILQYFALFLGLGLPMFWLTLVSGLEFPFSGLLAGVTFGGIYVGLNALLKTEGFLYSREYLLPLIAKIRQRIK